MTNELHTSITQAFKYLSTRTEIPVELMIDARMKGIKADKVAGDLTAINKRYHDAITKALLVYFDGNALVDSRNTFKQAMINAFGDAFDLGWTDGGGKLPIDEESLDWLGVRMNQEASWINMLYQEAKALKKDKEFDYFEWISDRADGYVNTLKEIYNAARARAMSANGKANMMVTFAGDDGAHPCKTCKKLKGRRRKLSWFIANNYIPPFGGGLDCARGGRCRHGLMDDNKNWVTI